MRALSARSRAKCSSDAAGWLSDDHRHGRESNPASRSYHIAVGDLRAVSAGAGAAGLAAMASA